MIFLVDSHKFFVSFFISLPHNCSSKGIVHKYVIILSVCMALRLYKCMLAPKVVCIEESMITLFKLKPVIA